MASAVIPITPIFALMDAQYDKKIGINASQTDICSLAEWAQKQMGKKHTVELEGHCLMHMAVKPGSKIDAVFQNKLTIEEVTAKLAFKQTAVEEVERRVKLHPKEPITALIFTAGGGGLLNTRVMLM